jgi:two-component system sensor histidine kinase BarA
VIFLDIEMPVMGGIEAAQEIRSWQRERGELPSLIAAFSAHDDDATRRQCFGAGFDLYLAKPASREEVFAVLRGQDPVMAAAPASPSGAPGDHRVWIEPGLMKLMPEFLASRRQLAEELAAAASRGDRATIRATAHKLAGSLAMYGFKEASRASRALEQAAASEDAGELRERCDALVDMLAHAEPVARPAA